ncbi:MAG: hypothetical protein ABIJ03_02355 [Patescibacteria group bacterium]
MLSRRATWRDYVDIAILLNQGLASLDEGIRDAYTRHQINEKWILEPLTYFDDIADQPIKFVGKQYTNDEIKSIIKRHARVYTKQKLT